MDDLLTRGVAAVYPNRETLAEALKGGRKLRLYWGIDPTGPTLHVGHLAVLLKLRDLQAAGHHIVVLFGDFTARIGDPSDKNAARQMLTAEVVENNLKHYREQIGKILDLKKVEFRQNSEWLAKLELEKLLPLAAEFTFAQMIERDMFQERIKSGAPIYLHEFFYPLLQGYDSVVLEIDLEVGGNDQTFNMLTGRTMLKTRGKEKFVLATKLLTDPTGAKMGKTAGNMVAFSNSANDAYGQVMSWPDALLPLGFELCTRVPEGEIKKILTDHPRDAKMRLAREIVTLIHDDRQASAAETEFVKTFQNDEAPSEWERIEAKRGEKLADILTKAGVVKSKSDFRRLVGEGAVHDWSNKNLIDLDQIFSTAIKLKIGKKRFVEIIAA